MTNCCCTICWFMLLRNILWFICPYFLSLFCLSFVIVVYWCFVYSNWLFMRFFEMSFLSLAKISDDYMISFFFKLFLLNYTLHKMVGIKFYVFSWKLFVNNFNLRCFRQSGLMYSMYSVVLRDLCGFKAKVKSFSQNVLWRVAAASREMIGPFLAWPWWYQTITWDLVQELMV